LGEQIGYTLNIYTYLCEWVDIFKCKNPIKLWCKGWVDSDNVMSGVVLY